RLAQWLQRRARLGVDDLDWVGVLDLPGRLQYFDHRKIRDVPRIRRASPLEHDNAVPDGLLELVKQPRLADARLAHERHDLALAHHRTIEQPVEQINLWPTADEADGMRAARHHRAADESMAGAMHVGTSGLDVEVVHEKADR